MFIAIYTTFYDNRLGLNTMKWYEIMLMYTYFKQGKQIITLKIPGIDTVISLVKRISNVAIQLMFTLVVIRRLN